MDRSSCNRRPHRPTDSFLPPSHLERLRLFDDPDDDDTDTDNDDDDKDMDDDDDLESVKTLQGFAAILSKKYFRSQRGAWIFRGHSSKGFELIPKVGRTTHTSATRQKFEISIFDMFK